MATSITSSTQRRLGIVTDTALLILTAVRNSGDAFPPLKSTAATILILVDTVQLFTSNKKDWQALANLIVERVAAIVEVTGTDPPPDLASNIEKLKVTLGSIVTEVKGLARRSAFVRSLQVQSDKRKIVSYQEKMKEALDSFNLIGVAAIWRATSSGTPSAFSQTTASSFFDVNTIPPTPPVHFYGRTDYLQSIVDVITSKVSSGSSAHLVIRGPGGIGKTSVALAAFHDPYIESLFKTNRYFVRCEAADTPSLLLAAVASALGISISKGEALKLVLQHLSAIVEPVLLFLDNAETFWLGKRQPEIRLILQQISALPLVSLVLTMRGTELPNVTSWDRLQPLDTLTLDAAREIFLAIASDQEPSLSLDTLLKHVDCVPLAVTLLARLSQMADSPETLCARWDAERTALLNLGNSDREDNIEISIKLSLESPPMKDNVLAYQLLGIISYLPDGTSETTIGEMVQLPASGLHVALHALKRLSLVHESARSWITTLSPIREYVRKHHPPQYIDIVATHAWHLALAKGGNCRPGDSEFLAISQRLSANNGNISYILQSIIAEERVSEDVIWAILHHSKFLYWTTPNSDVMEQLLHSNANIPARLRAMVLQSMGDLLRLLNKYDAAQAALEDGLTQFVSVGDQLGAAECLRNLGDIMKMQSKHDAAHPALLEARKEFLALGNRLLAAQCSKSIAEILRMQDKHDAAKQALEEAKVDFEAVGDRLGVALCLRTQGDIMLMQDNYVGAEQALQEARTELVVLGNAAGAAHCLRILGDVFLFQDKYCASQDAFEEARGEFIALGSRVAATQCLEGIGENKLMENKYDEAQQMLEEARTEFVGLGTKWGVAHCTQLLGEVMQMRGQDDEAQKMLIDAETQFSNVRSQWGAVHCRRILGDILRTEGEYEEAQQTLEEARTQFVTMGNRLAAAQCSRSLGDIMHMKGDSNLGKNVLEEAMREFTTIGNRLGAADCLRILGEIMQSQGNYIGAQQALVEASSRFVGIGNQRGAAQCLCSLGENMRMQGNYYAAQQSLEEARESFSRLGCHGDERRCIKMIDGLPRSED